MSRRNLVIVASLVTLQLAAVAIYFVVQARRDASIHALSTAAPIVARGQIGSFEVTMRDGSTRELVGDRPVLVHFWATWCTPCLDELPLVLALDDGPYDVVAVALDADWTKIDHFTADLPQARLARADRATAEQQFELSSLPQTVLMRADGTLLLRVNGARNWSDAAFLAAWLPQ